MSINIGNSTDLFHSSKNIQIIALDGADSTLDVTTDSTLDVSIEKRGSKSGIAQKSKPLCNRSRRSSSSIRLRMVRITEKPTLK
jgi:hypothetical protein